MDDPFDATYAAAEDQREEMTKFGEVGNLFVKTLSLKF